MNYLIVGDYKFLGRKLGEKLCKDNTVVFMDRNVDNTVSDIGLGVVADISSEYALRTTCSKYNIDSIVLFQQKMYNEHFGYDPLTEYKTYSGAVGAVASLLKTHTIKHVYLRSSYETYGVTPNKVPKTPIKESSVGQPVTYRGAFLRSLEDFLRIHCYYSGVKFTALRLFEIFGEDKNVASEWLLPYVLQSVLNDKTAVVTNPDVWKDFIYVDEAVEALDKIIRSGYAGPINVGTGRAVKVKRVLSRIKKLSERKDCIINVNVGNVPPLSHVANIELLSKFYVPSVKWEDKLEELVSLYRGK